MKPHAHKLFLSPNNITLLNLLANESDQVF